MTSNLDMSGDEDAEILAAIEQLNSNQLIFDCTFLNNLRSRTISISCHWAKDLLDIFNDDTNQLELLILRPGYL